MGQNFPVENPRAQSTICHTSYSGVWGVFLFVFLNYFPKQDVIHCEQKNSVLWSRYVTTAVLDVPARLPSTTGELKSEKLSPSWETGQEDGNFKSCPFIKISNSNGKKKKKEKPFPSPCTTTSFSFQFSLLGSFAWFRGLFIYVERSQIWSFL